MSAWIQEVPIEGIQDGTSYFIGFRPRGVNAPWLFVAENRKGKRLVSQKPGIAVRALGNDKLRDLLRDRPDIAAIAIPADADRRWRMRG